MLPPPPRSTLFPYTTLFRSALLVRSAWSAGLGGNAERARVVAKGGRVVISGVAGRRAARLQSSVDRKSTRLNSSHSQISYAVFCLKKKKKDTSTIQIDESRD